MDEFEAPAFKTRTVKWFWLNFECGHRRRWWKRRPNNIYYCYECDDWVKALSTEDDSNHWKTQKEARGY